ncbi:hypothetical protein ACIRU3_12895 [Streptomyces sp. NPDC101151]|uniref:hypothetical protein n=1 Tax=Streptomyces sp. NPDC101151 TaxID=3366115 RepID=UPI00382490BD
MKDRVVQLVVGLGGVEELAVLLWSPHHDATGYDAGLAPPLHACVCPQQRIGAGRRCEVDVLGWVECDDLLCDCPVQGGTQGAADALDAGGSRDFPEGRHFGKFGLLGGDALALGGERPAGLGRLAARGLLAPSLVLGGDYFGLVCDGVEQFGHVPYAEPFVDDEMSTVRLQVHTDVRLVAIARGRSEVLLSGHVFVEQVAEGDCLGKAPLGPNAALYLVGGGNRRLLVGGDLCE